MWALNHTKLRIWSGSIQNEQVRICVSVIFTQTLKTLRVGRAWIKEPMSPVQSQSPDGKHRGYQCLILLWRPWPSCQATSSCTHLLQLAKNVFVSTDFRQLPTEYTSSAGKTTLTQWNLLPVCRCKIGTYYSKVALIKPTKSNKKIKKYNLNPYISIELLIRDLAKYICDWPISLTFRHGQRTTWLSYWGL